MRLCIRKEVECDLEEARSCANLKVLTAHAGSGCTECAYGVGSRCVRLLGLDMMSSVMMNTCDFDHLKLVDICHTCQTSRLA